MSRLTLPTEPTAFLHALCATLSPRLDRPVRLKFLRFPPGLDLSGMTFAKDDEYVVVVEDGVPDAHKFVIAGHELGHCYYGTLGVHYAAGLPAAARGLPTGPDEDISWDRVVALATRSPAAEDPVAEWEAEECGLRLAAMFHKIVGPHATSSRLTQETLTERLSSSLTNVDGL
ncbi:hypothetical protein ABZ915_13540 [Streptomyces sp. NPDC046915]|uniref:hypothetical protein n=1 Tax=Streptomyces sp. NPDC046915 TaxID=3155257 RepID=UPI0033D25193